MDSAPPEYSVWLLPEAQSEQRLVATIAELAASTSGVAFWPHVTIQGDIALPLEEISTSIAQLASRIEVQPWRVQRVETSANFFRCLYLRFDDQPAFDAMQRDTTSWTRTASGLSPFPHLSLAYAEAGPAIERLRDAQNETFAELEILFDRLVVARSSSSVPIAEWRPVREYALTPL